MENTYKLLIVEDDKDMADELQILLIKWKFETVICRDFDDILRICEEEGASYYSYGYYHSFIRWFLLVKNKRNFNCTHYFLLFEKQQYGYSNGY